jgi:hypothetical protein
VRILALVDIFCVFNIYPERVATALTELSFPFVLSSFLLFTLYWHEMMTSSSVIVHPFLNKMKIPFFLLSGIMLALQIIRTILRHTTTIDNLPLMTGTIFWKKEIPNGNFKLQSNFY